MLVLVTVPVPGLGSCLALVAKCCLTEYLLLFGVELEALIQCAAVLLDVLLLLIPHALRILHHLLLDVAKQAASPGQEEVVTYNIQNAKA